MDKHSGSEGFLKGLTLDLITISDEILKILFDLKCKLFVELAIYNVLDTIPRYLLLLKISKATRQSILLSVVLMK